MPAWAFCLDSIRRRFPDRSRRSNDVIGSARRAGQLGVDAARVNGHRCGDSDDTERSAVLISAEIPPLSFLG